MDCRNVPLNTVGDRQTWDTDLGGKLGKKTLVPCLPASLLNGILLGCSGPSGFTDEAEVENADYFSVECRYIGCREMGLGRSRSRYINGFSPNWPIVRYLGIKLL